ncbi:catechol 2,3-dioxygenase-like lactoylglutathione lyase family enzyme [Microvirga lupini]|uniref:Catechol 2,3-dioxygenase-like lactoylglutathione lyase family enzyme n=1 Tax=Microvirga lupini TaxID=420324 RepID=A0A7W4YWT9_9HYPH|nr:VOC family protein [Microvirga lupini]MBB3019371.1 catechol 2,3-dioxygenase-like lactoylglutathione lyase family enzyme [Microvirga lupini]
MKIQAVHHVAIATRDLERSLAFYSGVLCLMPAARPDFPVAGAWLDMGSSQVHLVVHPEATFRANSGIDNNDCHFALQVEDFDAALDHLNRHGYAENASEDSGKRLLVKRHGPAGFPQVYLLDPDGHIVEINAKGD